MSFKIFTDIMTQYINDENIYLVPKGPPSSSQAFIGRQSTEIIHQIIEIQIFPKILHILKECQDPIPMFGLRLLNSIVERNSDFIPKLK
jgi:hypothetical protein